jgi:hypothetical protein
LKPCQGCVPQRVSAPSRGQEAYCSPCAQFGPLTCALTSAKICASVSPASRSSSASTAARDGRLGRKRRRRWSVCTTQVACKKSDQGRVCERFIGRHEPSKHWGQLNSIWYVPHLSLHIHPQTSADVGPIALQAWPRCFCNHTPSSASKAAAVTCSAATSDARAVRSSA